MTAIEIFRMQIDKVEIKLIEEKNNFCCFIYASKDVWILYIMYRNCEVFKINFCLFITLLYKSCGVDIYAA